ADPTNLHACTVDEVPSPARETNTVMAAMPAHADAVAVLPRLHAGSDLVDDANHLVSGHARIRDPREPAVFRDYIAVADPTCLNANPNVARGGLRNVAFHDFKIRARLRHLNSFHLCHFRLLLTWFCRSEYRAG